MKLVYIAHPLGAGPDRSDNLARAARWVAWAASRDVAPSATWIVLASQWPGDEAHRTMGLACDVAAVVRCDELWLVGGRVSAGMRIEADIAEASGIPVVDLTHLGPEPPS